MCAIFRERIPAGTFVAHGIIRNGVSGHRSDRAEGTATELGTELEVTKRSAEAGLAATSEEAVSARSELAEQLAHRCEPENGAARAPAARRGPRRMAADFIGGV